VFKIYFDREHSNAIPLLKNRKNYRKTEKTMTKRLFLNFISVKMA
jgi:hypothetical protein